MNQTSRVSQFISSLGKPARALLVGASLILLEIADEVTGNEISLSVFYLFPVMYATWLLGRNAGLLTSVVAAVLWHIANATEASHPLVPYWNSATRLVTFSIVALLLAKIRADLEYQKNLANTDFLTGALSKRAFFERVEMERVRASRQDTPLTLLYLDADNFKQVNDERGHEAGDQLLKVVVQTAKQTLRQSDSVARLGGDEFAVLLPDTPPDRARQVIDKLCERLTDEMARAHWPVTFSIGVLTCRRPPPSFEEMIKLADGAMYQAKQGGKNQVRFMEH